MRNSASMCSKNAAHTILPDLTTDIQWFVEKETLLHSISSIHFSYRVKSLKMRTVPYFIRTFAPKQKQPHHGTGTSIGAISRA